MVTSLIMPYLMSEGIIPHATILRGDGEHAINPRLDESEAAELTIIHDKGYNVRAVFGPFEVDVVHDTIAGVGDAGEGVAGRVGFGFDVGGGR
jgi:hypothetical protein